MYTIDSEEIDNTNQEKDAKLSDNSNSEQNMAYPPRKKGKKKLIFVVLILTAVLGLGFFLRHQIKSLTMGQPKTGSTPTPTQIPTPTPTPNPLIRSDWSFEVLNGSGVSGLAKKVADKINGLGYQVIKVGNADKDNYPKTQILLKSDLKEKLDLVIADLKDAVKIASVGGELKDSTASARVILGKD